MQVVYSIILALHSFEAMWQALELQETEFVPINDVFRKSAASFSDLVFQLACETSSSVGP